MRFARGGELAGGSVCGAVGAPARDRGDRDDVWRPVLEALRAHGAEVSGEGDPGAWVLDDLKQAAEEDLKRQLHAGATWSLAGCVWDALDYRVALTSDRALIDSVLDVAREAIGAVADSHERNRVVRRVVDVAGGLGQYYTTQLAFLEFFEVIGVLTSTRSVEPLQDLARSCGAAGPSSTSRSCASDHEC